MAIGRVVANREWQGGRSQRFTSHGGGAAQPYKLLMKDQVLMQLPVRGLGVTVLALVLGASGQAHGSVGARQGAAAVTAHDGGTRAPARRLVARAKKHKRGGPPPEAGKAKADSEDTTATDEEEASALSSPQKSARAAAPAAKAKAKAEPEESDEAGASGASGASEGSSASAEVSKHSRPKLVMEKEQEAPASGAPPPAALEFGVGGMALLPPARRGPPTRGPPASGRTSSRRGPRRASGWSSIRRRSRPRGSWRTSGCSSATTMDSASPRPWRTAPTSGRVTRTSWRG